MPNNKAPTPKRQAEKNVDFAPQEQPTMPVPHFLETLLDRPVAFHCVFAQLTKSLNAGIMLSQAVYWSKRTKDPEGWFYKSQAEWTAEIYLSRYEQESARACLRLQVTRRRLPGFWHEQRRGLPARIYYRIDFDALTLHLNTLHQEYAENLQTSRKLQPDLKGAAKKRNAEKPQSRMRKTSNLDRGKVTDKPAKKSPTRMRKTPTHSLQRLHTETTSETTTSSSSTRARAKRKTKLLPPVQRLYCSITGNPWQSHDEKAAEHYQSADPRKIELALIETMLQTEQAKIQSFGYFVPRLKQWLSTELADDTINTILEMRRAKWREKGHPL